MYYIIDYFLTIKAQSTDVCAQSSRVSRKMVLQHFSNSVARDDYHGERTYFFIDIKNGRFVKDISLYRKIIINFIFTIDLKGKIICIIHINSYGLSSSTFSITHAHTFRSHNGSQNSSSDK